MGVVRWSATCGSFGRLASGRGSGGGTAGVSGTGIAGKLDGFNSGGSNGGASCSRRPRTVVCVQTPATLPGRRTVSLGSFVCARLFPDCTGATAGTALLVSFGSDRSAPSPLASVWLDSGSAGAAANGLAQSTTAKTIAHAGTASANRRHEIGMSCPQVPHLANVSTRSSPARQRRDWRERFGLR
jgi:hypothetical protein